MICSRMGRGMVRRGRGGNERLAGHYAAIAQRDKVTWGPRGVGTPAGWYGADPRETVGRIKKVTPKEPRKLGTERKGRKGRTRTRRDGKVYGPGTGYPRGNPGTGRFTGGPVTRFPGFNPERFTGETGKNRGPPGTGGKKTPRGYPGGSPRGKNRGGGGKKNPPGGGKTGGVKKRGGLKTRG